MEEKYKKNLAGIFKEPPNEFRMMPFWFWNHEMVEKEVTRQIQDHHDHGIGGEFIHPRHGRLTPYMGRRWLENVEAAADKCKELDMWCFLYDEDNWPSGPVSGLITGPYNYDNRGKFLTIFDEETFEGPGKIEYDLDYAQIAPETKFYAAIAVPEPEIYPDLSAGIDKAIDVTQYVEGDKLIWDVPDGEWMVILFCVVVNSYKATLNGYIDILREETVSEFIEKTHKKYIDWFIKRGKKDYVGTVVPGIFTDEPSMSHYSVPASLAMKWEIFTPKMPDRFKEMWGYDFNSILLSLFYDTGKVAAKHRCHYWETATDLYVNAFYKQIYDYCDKYNFRSTGHVNSEGVFPSHIYNQGDFFKVFEYMHYGGCDQLTEDVRPDGIENFWNYKGNPYTGFNREGILASKFASSAAHLLGKPRVLVEAFGTSSWDITLASCKRVNDFLVATGCDLFVPHDFAYSEDGYRKQDHPASFYHQPYYKHWKKLMDHNGRLCSVLNAHTGVLQTDILYFYPAKSFYAESMPKDTASTAFISDIFTHSSDCFMRQQLDFEFANEELIIGSEIVTKNTNVSVDNEASLQQNAVIKIRDETFPVLFLGASTCITLKFAKFLKEYYDLGGKIIAAGLLPFKEAHNGADAEIIEIIKYIFNLDPEEIYDSIFSKNKNSTKNESTGEEGYRFLKNENSNGNGGVSYFLKSPLKTVSPWNINYFPTIKSVLDEAIPVQQRRIKLSSSSRGCSYIITKHKVIDKKPHTFALPSEENDLDEGARKHLFFLANTSRNISYPSTNIVLNVNEYASNRNAVKVRSAELWDTLTGDIIRLKENEHYKLFVTATGVKVGLCVDFMPYTSYLFVINTSAAADSSDSTDLTQNVGSSKDMTENLGLKPINRTIRSLSKNVWQSNGAELNIAESNDTESNDTESNKKVAEIEENKEKENKMLEFQGKWKVELESMNAALLYKKWMSSYRIEAGERWSYRSVRTFTHDFEVKGLEEITKNPVYLVIEGLTGDYAWGKSTYETRVGGDRATFSLGPTTVTLNGNRLNLRFNFDYIFLDPGWIVVDVTRYLKEGLNSIKMESTTRNHAIYHVVTDPWKIIGKFSVDERDAKENTDKVKEETTDLDGIPLIYPAPEEIELKDIREQGLGRYHGGLSYVNRINIPEEYEDKQIQLWIDGTTDCVEVHVNSNLCGIMWQSWAMDVTKYIEPGKENEIKLVYYGIAQNMLQTNTKSQGLRDRVYLKIL